MKRKKNYFFKPFLLQMKTLKKIKIYTLIYNVIKILCRISKTITEWFTQ